MEKQTLALHTKSQRKDAYGAIGYPVYHSASYEFDDAQEMSDVFCGRILAPDYSRTMNPTVTFFEDKVKDLTSAKYVTAFNSGMAAISNTLLALSASGKNIVSSRHLFGNTFSLISSSLKRFGVEGRFIDLTNLQEVEKAIDANTCCIFLEIMTNPQLEVADIRGIAEIAHRRNILVVADSTIIPFTEFSSHALGVDIEVVSSTKYISGGATSLGGLIIDYGHSEEFSNRIKNEMLFNFGAYMTPHVAYMQTLGLETLNARYRVQSYNAQTLAERLENYFEQNNLPYSVNYAGLPSHPFHNIAKTQFSDTYGAMITLILKDCNHCFSFLNNLKTIRRATNLFDNKSLAIHPASTIFGNFTPEQRKDMDVSEKLIRLSIGLESVNDIFNDIIQAL